MIKIDHATFTYGENNEYSVGIRDIDLEIEDGQVIVLCGACDGSRLGGTETPLQ